MRQNTTHHMDTHKLIKGFALNFLNFVSHHQIKFKKKKKRKLKNPSFFFFFNLNIIGFDSLRELTGLGLLGGGDEVDWGC